MLPYNKFAGKPSQPNGLTASPNTSNGFVFLTWSAPLNSSHCVANYIINSTFAYNNFSTSNTLNLTLSPVGGVVTFCKGTASVAANDTAGTIGDWSDEVEFVIASK